MAEVPEMDIFEKWLHDLNVKADQMDEKTTALAADLESLSGNIATLTTKVEGLVSDLAALTAKVADLSSSAPSSVQVFGPLKLPDDVTKAIQDYIDTQGKGE